MQRSLSEVLLAVLVEIAMRQDDPAERDAMLQILRNDGWLPDDERRAA